MSNFDPQKHNYSQPQSWTPNDNAAPYHVPTAAEVSVADRLQFIRKVYALFFAAILFAVGGVMLGFANPGLMIYAAEHPWIMFFLLIGGVLAATALRHKPGINYVALFGFTTLTGVVISPLLYIISITNPASITQAGVLTVGIFGGLTIYAFVSKRDFSFLRGFLTVGLVIIILAGLLNVLAIGSMSFGFALACGTLLLFSGYVLYDTSNIIRRYPTNEYVAGALDLYLDAFNIFLALLRILNSRD
jgi:modulator of FtsH protease